MKYFFAFSFISLLFSYVSAQTFVKAFGGAQEEFAYSFQNTDNNGFVVAGRTFSVGVGGWDSYITRMNANGDTLWFKTYGNTQYDEFQDVDTTSDGGFIAVGHTWTNDWAGNVYVVRTDGNGTVIWSKEFGGATGLSDKGYSIRETSDGGFIVCGTTATYGSGSDDVYVLKITSAGALSWSAVIGTAGANEAGREVQQTSDGGYIVAGYTDGSGTSFYDVYLIKLNSAGTVQWKKTYGGSSYDFAYTVQQTTDGGFVLGATTNSFGAGNWDAYLIKTDASGTLQWSKTYGMSGEDRVQCARQTSDGGYILCGRSSSFGAGNFDATLHKTDANGNLQWTKGFGGGGDDQGWYVRQLSNNAYALCGYTVSFGAGIKDALMIRTDLTGLAGCVQTNGTNFTTTTPATITSTIGNTTTGGGAITAITAVRRPSLAFNVQCASTGCTPTSSSSTISSCATYNWAANNQTYTSSGTYTTILTNAAGCDSTLTLNLTINPNPVVNAGADQSICSGTSVTLSATGASSYIWNNGITNGGAFNPTATATYIVTGTSNGCIGTDQVTVTVNNLPNVNAGVDQSICSGTSVTLTATGATTYSWNNGVTNGVAFSPAATTTYTVTGTSNGCTGTDQVTVTLNNLPIVNAGIDQSICLGQSVTLVASGATTYTWDQNVTNGIAFSPTSTSTYTVTGTSNLGCTASDQVTVTVNNSSASTVTQTATDSYTMNGQTYTQSGTYTQVIGNVFGCDSTITLILTINTSGLEELLQNIRVFPNPTRDLLTIERLEGSIQPYMISDATGRIITEGKLTEKVSIIQLGAFAPGFYSIKIGELTHPVRVMKE